MQAVVDGLLTNYRRSGRGKTVVLLHGWADDSSTFSELASRLSSKYTVLAVDLPGFGGSQAPAQGWSLADYATFVNSWLKKIGADEIEAILGHSFGGAVAIKALADKKLSPKKLILMAASGIRQKRPLKLKALKAGAKIGKIPLYLLPKNKAQKIKLYLYHRAGSDAMLRPEMRKTFALTVKEDLRHAARSIAVPTLLIYASQDRETPLADGQILGSVIKNSQLEVIDSGHFLHHDQPDRVAQLILDFLAKGER